MNIVLLDRNSNPVTKSGVTGVNLITDSGEEKIFEPPFSMNSAYMYFLKSVGDGGEYLVLEGGGAFGGATGKFFHITSQYIEQNGYDYQDTKAVVVLVSKNTTLEVGKTYPLSVLQNG